MDLSWSVGGQVTISMINYVFKILEDFIEAIRKTVATPARDKIFWVRAEDMAEFLTEGLSIACHRVVVQLLLLSLHAQRDMQLPISFLTKRVQKPNRDDWGELLRVLEYLNGTKHMKLTLKVDNLSVMNWFVDASPQIHAECKGHTGREFTLGKGAVTSILRWQKANTKSSIETNIVVKDDILPRAIWTTYLLRRRSM